MESTAAPDESSRLATLARHRIMDTPPDPSFDYLVAAVAAACRTPIALIGFLDDKRLWFKARHGLELTEIPRQFAFCDYTIAQSHPVWVKDARRDSRFRDNPLVVHPPHLVAYAGVALRDGEDALGSICVFDSRPRPLEPRLIDFLMTIGLHVSADLQLRRRALEEMSANSREHNELLERVDRALLVDTTDLDRVAMRLGPLLLPQLGRACWFDLEVPARHRIALPPGHSTFEIWVHRVTVPLSARGRSLGSLTVVGDVPYAPATRALIEEIARRASFAFENARLYDDAKRAVKSREDLLALVSHDLRSPIGSLAAGADLMIGRLRAISQPDLLAHAQRLKRTAMRMAELLGTLLDSSALEAGHLILRKASVRVQQIIEDTIDVFEPLAKERGLDLAVDVAGEVAERQIQCDARRVIQVLSNLLANAFKFSPPHGQISIRVQTDPAAVRFQVADQGPGVPPSEHKRIFERYYSGERARPGGVGLGLFIARGIVELHGGSISVDSQPGQGSVFSFSLPLASDRANS